MSEPSSKSTDEQINSDPKPMRALPRGLPTHLSLPRQALALAMWPFMEQVLTFLVGLVDMILAGHDSVEAANAVAPGAHVVWLIGLLQGALAVGASAIIARLAGAGDWDEAHKSLSQMLTAGVIWGGIIGLVFFLLAPGISAFVELEGESRELCTTYLRIVAVAAPLRVTLFLIGACLRGSGDTRTPFFVMIAVNIVNIIASYMLVYGPDPIGGWGVTGIAMGTLIGWLFGGVLMLVVVFRGWTRLHIDVRNLKPSGEMVRRLIRIGRWNLVENVLMWSGNFVILKFVGMLDDPFGPGAHMIVIRIEAISFLPGYAIGMAAAVMTGQYLGVNDPESAKRSVWICIGYAAIFTGLCGTCFVLFAEPIVNVATNIPVLREQCPPLLYIVGWVQIFFALHLTISPAMRGAGDTHTPMIIMMVNTFLMRLPLVYVLAFVLDYGLVGIWMGLAIDIALRGLIFLTFFIRGKWLLAKV